MTSTAVRVALRVRPLTQKEQLSNCTECLSYIPNEPQILIGTDKSFTYDYVFDTKTDQNNVYETAAAPLVQKLMDGFNATILAYGQTGSGKTYSMGTGLENSGSSQHAGIVPRCISELFEKLDARAEREPGYSFEIYVSFLELYNEELVDLLNPTSTTQKRKSTNGTITGTTEVTIREDTAGNIYWSGVKEERCFSPEELLGLLAKGSLCRTTASTDMNAVSSRSHAIFSVILRQQEPDGDRTKSLTSKFHFVDLAGSERLKRTNAQGDRAREGIAINAGLLALGNVISALGDETRRPTHVPYRDSKLTRLLQDSLGGNSQTLMLACVSPADINFMETLNTLKYANRARNIKNRVTVNQDFAGSSIEVNQLKALVGRLRMEIAALRAESSGSAELSSNTDQVHALKNENKRLRDRIDDMSAELIQTSSERDMLLMERELGEIVADTLQQQEQKQEQGRSNTYMENVHPLIIQYQKKIQDLTNELADTRDRLTFFEDIKPTIQAMALTKASISGTFSGANNRSRIEPSISSRRRRVRRRRGGRVSASSSSNTASKKAGDLEKKNMSTTIFPDADEDEGFVNDIQDEDIRREVKDSIAKAREEIRKGMEVLELIKPSDETAKAWEDELQEFEEKERQIHMNRDLSDEGTYSALTSPTYEQHFLHNESDIMDDLEDLAVPAWENSAKLKLSSRSATNQTLDGSNTLIASADKYNPQLVRILHQIQADIKVKEDLVSHLEKSETEYIFMRRKFDDKISHLQAQLAELQRERDSAVDRTKTRLRSKSDVSVQQKEKQQLNEIRNAYEAKTKLLLSEIQDLRRKYAQMTSAMQATRNQNETLLRSLRANVDSLQVEKKRMVKRMKVETERVREQMCTQERKIHQLQRQQAEATMAKRRLEREHETQKMMLKKRNEEILVSHSQLKQMINILKKAVREGGMLDERLLSRVSHIIGGNFAIVARGGFGFNNQNRMGRKKVNAIPVQVRAKRKKQLLDKALSQYIQGKQAIVEMEQLLVRRERLAAEKIELLDERKHIFFAEKENAESTGMPMDMMAIELMDERIDLMSAEISYLSARIRSLQSEAAGESMEDENQTPVNIRAEKHVTFADEIVADSAPTDEWADMDAFEEQFSVPSCAAPEVAYDVTLKILKSLEADESKRIAQVLVDDIMVLRMNEFNRQVAHQNLEKTVMDLRRTLIVMKRAAIATTVENERRIRKLEESFNGSDDCDKTLMDTKIEDYINSGNTIFDKIYEDGLRGLIVDSEVEMEYALGSDPQDGPLRPSIESPFDECASHTPMLPEKAPQSLKQNRDITPSPDRFLNMIQKRLSWQQQSGGSDSPVPITMISPAEFARYATDRDSSTSSIRSGHLRRNSLPSDYSSTQSQRSWNNILSNTSQALQHLPIHEQLPSEDDDHAVNPIPSLRDSVVSHSDYNFQPPLPPSSPLAVYSSTPSTPKQYKRHTMPVYLPTMTQDRPTTPATNGGDVFARLSQTPTRASRAKQRHSSSSVEDLKKQWDGVAREEMTSPFY
ncbi:hypothetical protein BX666DRAFT_2106249 [Dichotomocladium elegans]|nr:hypothetical protein BX666DRAFT_2106249 [Dichotomocladium elegans]